MPPLRRRNGARNILQPDGHNTKSSSSRNLLGTCTKHQRVAKSILITVLFLWVGVVALFLSTLQSSDHAAAATSPISTRDNQAKQLRGLSPYDQANHAISRGSIPKKNMRKKPHKNRSKNTKRKHQNQRHAKTTHSVYKKRNQSKSIKKSLSIRDKAAAFRLSQLAYGGHNHAALENNMKKQLQAIEDLRERKAESKKKKQTEMDLLMKSTQVALDSSEPYEQRHVDVPPPSANIIGAFAAEKYLDASDSMGDDDDSLDTYYALDDDVTRGKRDEKTDKYNSLCSTPTFYRLYRPTCNGVHEIVSGYQWLAGEEKLPKTQWSRYLGSGAYRQVFLLERQFESDYDEVIFKTMKRKSGLVGHSYNPEETYKNFELYDDMRKDSMVMELLTSSPRIANIYLFCALSSVIEYAPGNIEDYVMPTKGEEEEVDDQTPVNEYIKPLEKLEMALELAKGIATMHGYSNGVIANVDVQIGQFCRGGDGLIKILDFNRAEVLLYDKELEDYCSFSNGPPPDGSLRAPEEIIDAPLTEKIDVYSVGNVFYSILTGLLVNRNVSIKEAHWRVSHGKTEEINVDFFESRSPAEMALVKAIQWCWTFEPGQRPSIFQIVEFLEAEVKKNW